MQTLCAYPWIERLGWTFAHFVWQGFLIALLYGAVHRWVATVSRPQLRYLLACAALAAMAIVPTLTWRLARKSEATHKISAGALPALVDGGRSCAPERWRQFLSWIAIVWFACELAFLICLVERAMAGARINWVLARKAPSEWQEILGEFCTWVGLHRPVCLVDSSTVQAPVVVGFLRPAVIVSLRVLASLSAESVELLLLRELARIRRMDELVNSLQTVVEALLFYHPAVWWISGHIRIQRESCCDAIIASVSSNSVSYVDALADWESARTAWLVKSS